MVGRLTGKRNNDIPGQCSESRERMAERQTNTTTGQKREKQRRKEKETEGGRREREVTTGRGASLSVQHS